MTPSKKIVERFRTSHHGDRYGSPEKAIWLPFLFRCFVLNGHWSGRSIALIVHVLSLAFRRSPVKRHLALLLNSLIPGSGLLLRHPGLWPAIPTVGGALGLSLLAVALVTNGSPTTIPLGWCGLTLWLVSVVAATWAWALMERRSSRDLSAIQPLFREIAGFYLTNQLPAAEKTARQLVILAAAEPGAWRLLALVTRAQGQLVQAAKYDRRAARLDLARM